MEDSTAVDKFFKNAKCYHVRITYQLMTLQSTFDIFKGTPQFLLSEEGSKDEGGSSYHHHMMIVVLMYHKNISDAIKKQIYDAYPNLAKGNPGHSIVQMKNPKRLASYTLKGDSFLSQGFDDQMITYFKLHSYDAKQIKSSFTDLLDDLIDDKIDLEEYAHLYFQLKGQSGQKVIMHNFRGHYLSVAIRKGVMDTRVMARGEYDRLRMMYEFGNEVQRDLKSM